MKKLFRWISLEPDWGNYKPVKPLLEPQELFVAIDVPDEHLTKGGHLTVEGIKFCIDQFQAAMADKKTDDDSVEDWDDDNNETESDEWDGE